MFKRFYRSFAAVLPQCCRNFAAVLPQCCRSLAAILPQFCRNCLVTRSFAACSFAAVLPQLFGHTQFCRTQFCRMQFCRNFVANVMQFCCSFAAILPQPFGRSFAAALLQQCCRSNVAAVLPQSFGHTQCCRKFCRNVAAMLPQFCRNSVAILTQLRCNFIAMLPQFCRNVAQFCCMFAAVLAHFGGIWVRSEVLFREGPNSNVLHGMETLVISQFDYDKINAFQIRIFRKILSIKNSYWSRVTNDTVMNTANTRAQNIDKTIEITP